jgi:transcriptional regulator with GAF, ATPase, and Fis domain
MSRFDLRDISQRLTASKDVEAVVFEFLGYLQAVRSDWRASLAFYEVSRDSLVQVYTRKASQLTRRDVLIPVDKLPTRLVRKFFHPSSFFDAPDRRSLLSHLFQNAPSYEPEPGEAAALAPLSPSPTWQSCVCLPLADREDLIAVLTITSDKRGAFPGKVVGEIIPLKSMASLALGQRLHQAALRQGRTHGADEARVAATDFQDKLQRLASERASLSADNQAKAEQLLSLTRELEQLDQNSSAYQMELERVKDQLAALEEQSSQATEHLSEAYTQLSEIQFRTEQMERTIAFLKDVYQVLSQDHAPEQFARTMVTWFSEQFGVERCSLMVPDDDQQTLRVHSHRGLDDGMAPTIKVRIGQGIAGWVAHNRKPLFVRIKRDATDVQHTHQDAYNSDSFISVPLVHQGRLVGVLNLSNKLGGEPFDQMDLDRAVIAGAVIASTMGGHEVARHTAAWS